MFDTGGAAAPYQSTTYGIYASADVIDNTVAGVFVVPSPGSAAGVYTEGYVARGNRISGLVPTGAASAMGIVNTYIDKTAAVDNQVNLDTSSVNNIGIMNMKFCANNTVAAGTPYVNCTSSSGNL